MKDHYKNLFEYESWANNEIAVSLSANVEIPAKAVSLMSHIINAQMIWLSRMQNVSSEIKVWQEYGKDELTDKLKISSEKLAGFLNSLSENDLNKVISYANTKGEKFETILSDILIHMSHHSAYHRGQIITLIKPFVSELPYTDYIHFIRIIKK
jgi:uncharacterized damage-inducible protein DinB